LITKLDTDGRPQWAKLVQIAHEVVVDPTEGVTWTGSGYREQDQSLKAQMDVSASSIFVVGNYSNQYLHGSNPPPGFVGVYGLALDYDGKVQWAKQYRVAPLDVMTGNTGSSDGTSDPIIKVMPDGNLTIAANRSPNSALPMTGKSVTFGVKVDGTLH